MTITEFLDARISEDEAAAHVCAEAFPTPWDVEDRGHSAQVTSGEPNFLPVAEIDQRNESPGRWPGEHLEHIARHDPARVLAECAAKRAIIAFHESWPVLVEGPMEFGPVDGTDPHAIAYRATQQIAWATQAEYVKRFGDKPPTTPMLRALATVYDDHPDYDVTWQNS